MSTETMASHNWLVVIFSLIFSFPSMGDHCSSSSADNEGVVLSPSKSFERNYMSVEEGSNYLEDALVKPQPHTHDDDAENGVVSNLRPRRGHHRSPFLHRHHLRNVPGILSIIGWGTLLPVGAIVARWLRKFPLKYCKEWYNLHVLCQSVGYILGTLGWGIGIWPGTTTSSNQLSNTHRILGAIIFTFSTVQILAVCWQPKVENEYRRWWAIHHQLLGYALIAMIIAYILLGIEHKSHQGKLMKWVYVGILVFLAFVGVALEIFTRVVKSRILIYHHQQQQEAFDSHA